jgi:arginyl-tRNA synthetase
VAAAVAWHGVAVVRYGLARTAPSHVAQLSRVLAPGASGIDPLYPVQHAHTSAVSVQRWAADLGLHPDDRGDEAGELLCSPAERTMLGLLPWLPVRVAAAARRHRPDELPGYLETVAAAWLTVRQVAPALPFGGRAAPADLATTGARLLLACAVDAVLASGLALTGAPACPASD